MPRHNGLIMDGNGRWAKKRGMPRYYGHSVGAKTFRNIAQYCSEIGIEYLTVYAFSTENWRRPEKEVNTILKLMRDYLKDFERYRELNMKIKFLGDLSIFDQEMRDMIANLEYESSFATGMNLNIAINYGGRNEIVMASRKIAEEVASGALSCDQIDEACLSDHLYTAQMPEVDLVIRPSGEQRLSNFLIWQCAYAEFVFMDVLWPDFSEKDLDEALDQYVNRNRRFGGV